MIHFSMMLTDMQLTNQVFPDTKVTPWCNLFYPERIKLVLQLAESELYIPCTYM